MIRVRDGDEERIYAMDEFEQMARRGEISPFAEVSLPLITGDRFVPARELALFTQLYDPRRQMFQRHFRLGRLPVVTLLVAATCIVFFLLARHLGQGAVTREALMEMGANARARIIDDGELWRLWMANLLHRDGRHLAFNMFALLNVGSVLEGVYRRADYTLMLVLGGVAAMAVSTVASGANSVGASGVVFCCLGAAVMFGLRYADLLPLRYRIYFGVVVIGYAAAMFYLGLRQPTTDNWGHAGGLLTGLLFGAVLDARMMQAEDITPESLLRERRRSHKTYAAVLAIMLALLLAGPLVPTLLFRWEPYRFDAFGIELQRPNTWSKRRDPLGFVSFGNGVDAQASLACALVPGGRALPQAATRFVDVELRAQEDGGHIASLDVRQGAAVSVASLPGWQVPFSFVASDGAFEARATVFVRGEMECALVLAHRAGATASSIELLDQIHSRLQIVDSKAQRDATNGVLNRPRDPRALLDLALAHQAAGDAAHAREAFDQMLTVPSSDAVWLAKSSMARARFELFLGGDLSAALRAAERALLHAPSEIDASLVLCDVLVRRGELARAKEVVAAALVRFGDDPRLLERRAPLQRLVP